MKKILTAFLCGHTFSPDDFENYPDDYAGYCPVCARKIADQRIASDDEDEEPDPTGIPEFDSDLPDDDDYVASGNDDTALDDYPEEDQEIEEDIFADDTEEEDDRLKRTTEEEFLSDFRTIVDLNISDAERQTWSAVHSVTQGILNSLEDMPKDN